jgi:hypothetical protein
VALVIVLALLVITLLGSLACAWVARSCVMAGNEQFRHSASTASSAGIEIAVARLTGGGASGELATDAFAASIRHTLTEMSLPGSSAEKFVGEHFQIRNTRTAARARGTSRVMDIAAASDVKTFDALEGAP